MAIYSVGQVVTAADMNLVATGLYRKTTSKTVNTTVAATDLLNGAITVAAGVMGTTGVLRLTQWGDWLNNTGGNVAPPRFQLLLGGTTLLDTSAGGGTLTQPSATRGNWRFVCEILNLGSASSQVSSLNLTYLNVPGGLNGSMNSAFTTGSGTYLCGSGTGAMNAGAWANGNNTTSVNTAVSAALVFNVINGSASASYETKLLGALVEII